MTNDQDQIHGEALFQKLGKGSKDADFVVDLAGMDLEQAREALVHMLEQNRFLPARSIVVRLGKPVEGQGETLFQPVGRMLLEARRHGLLSTLSLLPPDDGIGYRLESIGILDGDEGADFDPHDPG